MFHGDLNREILLSSFSDEDTKTQGSLVICPNEQ